MLLQNGQEVSSGREACRCCYRVDRGCQVGGWRVDVVTGWTGGVKWEGGVYMLLQSGQEVSSGREACRCCYRVDRKCHMGGRRVDVVTEWIGSVTVEGGV